MKKDKIIYWVTTGLISALMLFSAFSYLTNEEVKAGFIHLGFPGYFRIELAIAKIIGGIVLLIPLKNYFLKEAAYVGFAITFVSAFVAHISSGDPVSKASAPLIILVMLAVSFIYKNKMVSQQSIG